MTNTPCFLGSKFEYYLTNNRLAKFATRVYQARTFAMPNGNNCSAECAPERGNEPPARGNTLGEQRTKRAAPRQGADSKERIQLGRLQRGCQRHQTKVASHTEKPLGFSNQRSLFAKRGKVNGWGKGYPNNNSLPLGRRHCLILSLT